MHSFRPIIQCISQYRRIAFVFVSFALILLNSLLNVHTNASYVADASFTSRVQFGTAIAANELLNPTVTNTLYDYGFHVLTPSYEAKMDTIKPTRDTDNYAPFDRIVDYATAHSMTVHGHTLVWNEQLPGWLTASSYAKEEYKAILQDYITKTMSRYCGRVQTWDVVNEALNGSGGLNTDNFWYQKIGAEYFTLSYQWAHQACPSAKLYYNDTGIENKNSASDGVYNKIIALRAQGITIDGVGLQTHDGGSFGYVNAGSMKENMDRFGAIGVEVAVSELDEQVGTATPSSDQLTSQANRYKQIATACMQATNCVRFTVWGLSDTTSWIRNDAPLLFDGNYQPKPAYWAVREALSGQNNPQPTQPAQPTPSTQPVSPSIIGSEDDMRANTLRGWACDTSNPSSTITVALFTENGTALVKPWQTNLVKLALEHSVAVMPIIALRFHFQAF
jgi:endo-1,4-beta-xylanase